MSLGTHAAIGSGDTGKFLNPAESGYASHWCQRKMKTHLLPYHSVDQSPVRSAKFPVIACAYQPSALPKFGGGCARSTLSSFRDISGQYFRDEARGEFQREMIAFGAIVLAAVIPLLSNAHALAQMLTSFGRL